ncbi:MAG: hypothetical protein P8Z37_11675 [Acidobacteriota bacterium]
MILFLFFFALLLVGCDGGGVRQVVSPNTGQTPLPTESNGTDAIDWTARLITPLPLKDVVWDGQVFVAVGYGGTVLTSVDGIDWVAQEPVSDDPLLAVTAFGSDIYAVGGSGVLLSTDHGETWTVKAHPDFFIGTEVAANSSQIVVIGTVPDLGLPRITISEDHGETWQTSSVLYLDTDTGEVLWDTIFDPVWDAGKVLWRNGERLIYRDGFFITTSGPTVMVSTDGKQWDEIVVCEEGTGLNGIIAYDDSQFFVASDDGTIYSSFDLFNWTELSRPLEDVDYSGWAWNGTQLILAGRVSSRQNRYDGTYRPIGISSIDGGASWDVFGIDSSYDSRGVAWGNGRFVSVGVSLLSDEGVIYTTD